MPDIKLDSFLKATDLIGATKASPKEAKIVSVELIPAANLKFKSEDDRWQLVVELGGEQYEWLANKTSMKTLMAAYGKRSEDWAGKTVKLFPVTQNVSGEMKEVVYAAV